MIALVETQNGKVQGVDRGGHWAFRGLPYAKPPVGPLRFLPPQPAEGWTGVRVADTFGNSAPQGASPIAGAGAEGAQSEDCLYLNVYTPAPDGARRPVMVWIHGGAFVQGTGSSPLFDGKYLCETGDVVVVTLNYRLGALGFLPLLEHEGARWGATANAGLLDQIRALAWVRDNIERFGGNPKDVTVFGESAGAMSVCTLMTMPDASGLFHRVIAQSGAIPTVRIDGVIDETAAALMKRLGVDPKDAQKLQEVEVERLISAQVALDAEAGRWSSYAPVVDGSTLPEPVGDCFRRGAAHRVPLLIGSNRDEWNLFEAQHLAVQPEPPIDEAKLYGQLKRRLPVRVHDRIAQLVGGYLESRRQTGLGTSLHAIRRAIVGDYTFRIPGVRVAEAHSKHEPRTFMYLFEHESPALNGRLGACHALELAFVFGTLDAPFQDRFAGSGEHVRRLSAAMMGAWIAFARGDTPNRTGLVDWSPYDVERRATMIFGFNTRVVDAPREAERALWEGVIF